MGKMKRVLSVGDLAMPNSDDTTGAMANSKRKKVSSTQLSVAIKDSQAEMIDDAIDSVLSQSVVTQNHESDLQNTVYELTQTVKEQQLTINKLICQMNFVLSFLNIADNEPQVENSTFPCADDATTSVPGSSADHISSHPANSAAAAAAAVVSASSWSAVAAKDIKERKPVKFTEAVMSAVYADKQEKERRSKSFIVSGLGARSGCDDLQNVMQLCSVEFGVNPEISFCKRLGADDSATTRPLLVALKSAEQAADIIGRAKSLRNSTNSDTRSNVYINPNLTKPEAHAAYLERCRRRQQATKRQNQQKSTDNSSSMDIDSMSTNGAQYSTRIVVNSQRKPAPAAAADEDPSAGRLD